MKNIEEGVLVLIDTLEANNAKIITWINNYVEQSIGTQLAKYETTKEVWDLLQMLFTKEVQFYIVLNCLLLTLLLVSYWLNKYVFSLILKWEFFLLQILQY